MSNRLQQLGIDRWPVADRLALLRELQASLPADPPAGGPRRPHPDRPRTRRDRREPARPWADGFTDLGGEG